MTRERRDISTQRRTRVAVVGAGYFAQFQYQAWIRIADVELVACANRTLDKATATAARYAIPAAFSNVDDMLQTAQPDVLDIITPPETHLETIRIAAAHGVDVICQKPFCATLDEARAAIAIAEAGGITIVIHENFRFQPWHRELKALLDAGAIGQIYQATFRLRPGDGQGPDAYLARQPYFQKMPRFLVHETAIHLIDTFRFLLGEATDVYAALKRLNPAIAGEDAGLILMNFEGGARALFDGNRLVDHLADNHRLTMGEMLIEGADGVLRLSGDGGIFHRTRGARDEVEIAYDWTNEGFGGDCVYLLQHAMIHARRSGQAYENDAAAYLRNLAIEEAVYRSNDTGCRIALSD